MKGPIPLPFLVPCFPWYAAVQTAQPSGPSMVSPAAAEVISPWG